MDKQGYVIDQFLWNTIFLNSFLWVSNLFREVGYFSLLDSLAILAGLVILVNILCIFTCIGRYRTFSSVLLNSAMPYGIYLMLIHFKENQIIFIALLAMVAGAVIFYSILLFGQKAGKQPKSRLYCRIGKVFHMSRIMFGVVFFIVYIGGLTKTIYDNHCAPNMEEKIEISWTEARMEEYLSELSLLHTDRWKKLSFEEKLDLMETIIEIEQQYLGISHSVELKAETLEDNTLGYYSAVNKLIVIESEILNYTTSWNAVQVVCHEMRHAYQRRLIDICIKIEVDTEGLLFFREVEDYFWEMFCYIDGDENFEAYHNQKIECDAREYAEERMIYYMQKLEKIDFGEE